MTRLDIRNLDHQQVLGELQALSQDLQTKALRSGLVSVAAPIKKAEKATAPVSDREGGGTLRQAIGHRLVTRNDADKLNLFVSATKRTSIDNPGIALIVGANRKVAGKHRGHIAAWLEHGLRAKSRRHLRGRKNGGRVKRPHARWYAHRGLPANSFQANALASVSNQIETRFYKGIARSLNRMR